MLKAQLHIHVKGDPRDDISYTGKELIDHAAGQGFDVLALTCHDRVIYDEELKEYAWQRGILLIPGVERTIEGKHVLIYNLTEEESQVVTSFKKLEELKLEKQRQNKPFLVAAAHPFHFGLSCLKSKVVQHLNLFDVWEYSFFYHKALNFNKKTIKLAQKYGKPMMGSSDVHRLSILGKTYSLINSEKNLDSVLQAIKDNQIRIITKPLHFPLFSKVFFLVILSMIKRLFRKTL